MQPCEVTITTTGGQSVTKRIDYPMGDPRHPMSGEALDAKFSSLAEGVISSQRREQLKEAVFALDTDISIRRLCGMLVSDIA